MSNMDTNESNNKSMSTINGIIEKSVDTTNELGITDKHPSKDKMNQVVNKLNYPFRKIAHASEYLIFSILLIIALKNSGISKVYLISLFICFIYACSDEFHQTFIPGRTGQFIDALIDTFGALIGIILFTIKNKLIRL